MMDRWKMRIFTLKDGIFSYSVKKEKTDFVKRKF